MAVITLDGGQSETVVNGQSTDYFVQKALMECPGAPDTLVQSKLQDVLRAFYTDTGAWRTILAPYKIIADRDEIQINPVDQYTEARYVLGAYIYPGVGSTNAKAYLKPSPRLLVGGDRGQPAAFFMREPDVMQLYPMPNLTYGSVLYIYAIIAPLIITPRLPNISVTHHFDAIMNGLLARMYAMPNRPWTDKDAAAKHERMYNRDKLRYRDEANRAYSSADAPFRFPRFANNGSQGGIYAAR